MRVHWTHKCNTNNKNNIEPIEVIEEAYKVISKVKYNVDFMINRIDSIVLRILKIND